ncbi:MAG: hypothetical protein CVU63_25790 [Deltaproteobacteria bacterium HGW-Deltaproteobacteria-20]|nr:MAG: hypothetical protein CVU63_25790 [Deltaproteobacteria bacterium HGW-Deltaproteobacteria-20]
MKPGAVDLPDGPDVVEGLLQGQEGLAAADAGPRETEAPQVAGIEAGVVELQVIGAGVDRSFWDEGQ